MEVAAPDRDDFELTLLGPGYGECALIHFGRGEWIVVDSCVDREGNAAALSYLKLIGVDAAGSVKTIVVTHWHDDHIRGITKVISSCPRADFVCPAAFRQKEFLAFVAAYADGAMMLHSGTQEIGKALALVNERRTTARLASENRLLLRRRGCELWALSPSDEAIRSALLHLAEQMPRPMESKTAVPAPTPNHLSVALLVQLAGTAILLGGDVLRFRADRKRGWLRIADLRREFDHPVSDVVKVPHHGSSGADAPEMWDHLLRELPVAALTPFRQGGVSLPKAGDVRRICARTAEAYITSLPRHGRPPKRTSAVEKTIEGFLRNRRLQSPPLGRVTLRCSSRERSRWTAQLAGAACRLHPGIL